MARGSNCVKLDECDKIKVILDKDMLDFQYADCIRKTCYLCECEELIK